MARPEANVTWTKDGKTVQPPRYLTREDGGSYVITAANKYGTKKHSLSVNVLCESFSSFSGVKKKTDMLLFND